MAVGSLLFSTAVASRAARVLEELVLSLDGALVLLGLALGLVFRVGVGW